MRRLRHNILWLCVRITAIFADWWLERALDFNQRWTDKEHETG